MGVGALVVLCWELGRCNEASFRSDCPRTCGVCTGPTLDISLPEPSTTLGATPETTTEPAATTTAECKDEASGEPLPERSPS
eukprot:2661838-Amphidinium_carterae.1